VSQFSSWSNAKGRVLTLLRPFRRGDDIYLALPTSLQTSVQKKLAMYVLRSKVALTDASSQFARLGVAGTDSPALLSQAGITVPTQANDVTSSDDVQAIRLHGAIPRYALYGSADALAAHRKKLEVPGAASSQEAWSLQKILAGEPTVHPETTEHFVAQMLDLDKLGGIDFKKGCYTGQEVIARSHYRGGVKRHLLRASSEGAEGLKPGAEIHVAGQGAPVAEVVDARRDATGLWQMLLVIQDDFRDARLVHGASGAAVRIVKG
jgi:folate-binding protein YgfZ